MLLQNQTGNVSFHRETWSQQKATRRTALCDKQNADMYPRKDGLINCLTELWFYVPLNTEQVISETFPQAHLLAWYGKKLNLTREKHAFSNQKKCTTTQNKHKKN